MLYILLGACLNFEAATCIVQRQGACTGSPGYRNLQNLIFKFNLNLELTVNTTRTRQGILHSPNTVVTFTHQTTIAPHHMSEYRLLGEIHTVLIN